jgi:hypothetical protein
MQKVKCMQCRLREVYAKGLCKYCYSEAYRQAKRQSPVYSSEMEFVRNYFTHKNWVSQPAKFRLKFMGVDLKTYTPDFYDGETGVFIEVSSCSTAYWQGKATYDAFRKSYPTLTLEVRDIDGNLCEEALLQGGPIPNMGRKRMLAENKRIEAEIRKNVKKDPNYYLK